MEENILVKVGADISDLTNEMGRAKKEVEDFGTRMTNLGRDMRDIAGGIALSFGAMATGIIIPLKQAVQTSVDFDTAMRRAATIAGATAEEFDALKQTALDLGASTTKSAQEVAVAMTEMAAKGYDVNQIIASMPGVIAAAEASGEDLALTADTVSSALNAFGLEASEATRVADILAETANRSAAGIQDMQYAFKYAAPVVSSLGVSIEELAAATGIMADVGIRGEQAGTTLRGGLIQLLKPAEKTSKMMESMGIQVTDANGKFIGLAGVIREFQKSMEGMTDAQKLATLSQIVGTEAASGFLALMKAGPSEIEKMTASLENSAGASQKAAEQMMGGIGGALEELSGAFETMRIIIGDQLTPIIEKFARWLTRLVDKFNNASPAVQKFVAITAAVVAGLFGLIAVIATVTSGIGLFMMSIGPLLTSITAAGGLLAWLGGIFGWLLSPITLTIAAIGAIAIAFNYLRKYSDKLRDAFDGLTSAIKSGFLKVVDKTQRIVEDLKDDFERIAKVVKSKLEPFIDKLADGIKTLGTEVTKVVRGDFTGLIKIFELIGPTIIGMLLGGIPGIIISASRILPTIAEGIERSMPVITETITKVITGIVDFIAEYLPKFVEIGVNILTNLIQGILNALPLIVESVVQIITAMITAFADNLPMVMQLGTTILEKLVEAIGVALPKLIDAGILIIGAITRVILDNLPQLIESGIKILQAIADGIISLLPTLIDAAIQLIMTIIGTLTDNLPKILDAGVKILTALIDGIVKALPNLITAAVRLVVKIAETLITNLPKIIEAGVKIIGALVKGLLQAVGSLLSSLKDKIIVPLINKFKEIDLVEVGKQIIKGLVKGMLNVPGLIWDGIKQIGNSIVNGFKDFFGINSPSRLMASIAEWIPVGAVKGIESMKSEVLKASNHLSEWLTPDVPEVSMAYSTPNGAYNTLSSAVRGTVDVKSRDDILASAVDNLSRRLDGMQVVLDGRIVGKLIAPTVSREINAQTSDAKRGGGYRGRIS